MRTTRKEKFAPSVSYRDDLLKRLRKSQALCAAYLNAALEDEDKVFLLALRDVVDAKGGITKLSRKTGLHRVSLHGLLSGKGNPRLDNLSKILGALNIRLVVSPKSETARHRKAS
jgi:probable addiction module antidote protein